MARGRMLSKSISTNLRIGLAGPDPALAWFLSLPHADIQGCLPGRIGELAMTCFPVAMNFFGWTHETIENLLSYLVHHGLWRLVVDDLGQKAIYVEKFREHQTGIREEREESKYVFSKGVESSVAMKPAEWRQVADIVAPPWRHDGAEKSAEVQVQVQVQVQEGEARARAKSEDRAEKPVDNSSAPRMEKARALSMASPSRNQEIAMIADAVIADFRAAHPMGEKAIIREHFDRPALLAAAHVLAELPDRKGFFRRAMGTLPPHRLNLEACLEKLNDPSIVNAPLGREIAQRNRILEDRAAALGITTEELRRMYDAGALTAEKPLATDKVRTLPVLDDELRGIDVSKLSGFQRVGEIAANGVMATVEASQRH